MSRQPPTYQSIMDKHFIKDLSNEVLIFLTDICKRCEEKIVCDYKDKCDYCEEGPFCYSCLNSHECQECEICTNYINQNNESYKICPDSYCMNLLCETCEFKCHRVCDGCTSINYYNYYDDVNEKCNICQANNLSYCDECMRDHLFSCNQNY